MFPSKRIACLVSSTLALAAPASANMAAPMEIRVPPSTALRAPVPRLQVTGETLTIECDFASCQVNAVYEIMSAAPSPADFRFRFILPDARSVRAVINGTEVSSVAPTRVSPEERIRWAGWDGVDAYPLYEAAFEGSVPAGASRIEVSYRQPLSWWYSRGYIFSSARGEWRFSYVMSPLGDWTLAESFKVNVTLRWRQPRRGFFRRLFGIGSRDVSCFAGWDPLAARAERIEREEDHEIRVLEYVFGRDFPAWLNCDGDVSPELKGRFGGDTNALAQEIHKVQDLTEYSEAEKKALSELSRGARSRHGE